MEVAELLSELGLGNAKDANEGKKIIDGLKNKNADDTKAVIDEAFANFTKSMKEDNIARQVKSVVRYLSLKGNKEALQAAIEGKDEYAKFLNDVKTGEVDISEAKELISNGKATLASKTQTESKPTKEANEGEQLAPEGETVDPKQASTQKQEKLSVDKVWEKLSELDYDPQSMNPNNPKFEEYQKQRKELMDQLPESELNKFGKTHEAMVHYPGEGTVAPFPHIEQFQ